MGRISFAYVTAQKIPILKFMMVMSWVFIGYIPIGFDLSLSVWQAQVSVPLLLILGYILGWRNGIGICGMLIPCKTPE